MNILLPAWPENARDFDSFGAEQKAFEKFRGETLMPCLPIIARLDGRSFHTFTKGLNRPFDINLQQCMEYALKTVCEQFQADLGYSQSDEISLVWYNADSSKTMFDGRADKYISLLASAVSVAFYKALLIHLPEKTDTLPMFDCRLFQVPSSQHVFNNILWRWLDAKRNSVSMIASHHFTVSELKGKSRKVRIDMLKQIGINWHEIDPKFKWGFFCKKVTYLKPIGEMPPQAKIDPVLLCWDEDLGKCIERQKYDIVANTPSLFDLMNEETRQDYYSVTKHSLIFSDRVLTRYYNK